MSSSMYTTEGVVVVTHVYPASQGAPQGAPQGAGQPHCVGVQKFSKHQPLVLGAIHIIVGLTVLMFGIVMAIDANSIGVFSGIFVWGPLSYITAGILTVAAGKRLNRPLVNAALAMCVTTALFSLTGVILYSLDAGIGMLSPCNDNDSYYFSCFIYQSRMQGISGILAIFNLLELIVSIVVAAFACNATCSCCEEPRSIMVIPAVPLSAEVPSVAQSVPQVENNYKNLEQPGAPGQPELPTYDSVIS